MNDGVHECNAGCQGDEHCMLVWSRTEDVGRLVRVLNYAAVNLEAPVRYVRAERAREAPAYAVWKAQQAGQRLVTVDALGEPRPGRDVATPTPMLAFWHWLEEEVKEQR